MDDEIEQAMQDDFEWEVPPPPALACATCGQPLGDDPEDEPDGDAGLPIRGECNRARNSDIPGDR